jgi:RNA polymerase sigma factor (sigma-70 family)
MFDARISTLLRRAARLIARPAAATTDSVLMDRFVRGRDPAAFAELVTRHGPAVWALCRRLLRTEADAEDVFQATFLVLARDAGRVRKATSVGSWLYGVAFRLGRRTRARLDRPPPDPTNLTPPAESPDPAVGVTWAEVRAALDEELARLPDHLRAPLLLCYFDGLTQDEAAVALGWNPRTLKARVAHGREVLRCRLTRRGVELPAALAAPLLSAGLASAVPPALAAAAVGVGRHPTGPDVSPTVLALARTEVSAMTTARLAFASVVVLLAAGAVLGLWVGHTHDPQPAPKPAPPAADPPPPAGAVAIGATHFRHVGWHARVFLTDGGNTLLFSGEGVTVRWWDVESGKTIDEIKLKGAYHDAAFARDGNLLAVVGSRQVGGETGTSEHVLWLIDVAGRKLIRDVSLPTRTGGNHQKVQVSANGRRVFVDYEGDVQVIDGKTGDELMRHKGSINAGVLAATPDGKLLAFGRHDVYLWRWETGEEPKKFTRILGGGTELIEFAPDGKTLRITPTSSELISTWDVATGRQIESRSLRFPTRRLCFSPDGKTMAVATLPNASKPPEDGHAIDLLDAATWNEVGRIPLGRAGVGHVSWSGDGSRLTAVTDSRSFVWDVKTGKVLGPTRPGHEGHIGVMTFGADGTLYTGSDDYTIRSWDPATGVAGLELIHGYWVRGIAVSPDGSLVVGSSLRNDLRVWDAKSGRLRYNLLGHGRWGGRRVVRFSPDGARLVSWGDDEVLRVWEVRNGKLRSEHSTRPGDVKIDPDDPFGDRMRFMGGRDGADISHDGSMLAVNTGKGIRILDTATGKERQTLAVGDGRLQSLTFSPDGKRVALAFRGKSVQTKLADGRTRFSTEKEYPVSVLDLESGKPVWTATAEGSWPGLAYSPDGSRVAVASNVYEGPSRVWLWDAATGKELGRIELPRRVAGHLAFDRTGKRLAVALEDTTALVYDLEVALKPTK